MPTIEYEIYETSKSGKLIFVAYSLSEVKKYYRKHPKIRVLVHHVGTNHLRIMSKDELNSL